MKDRATDNDFSELSSEGEESPSVMSSSQLEESGQAVSKMEQPPSEELQELISEFRYRSSPLPDPEDLAKYEKLVPGISSKMLNSYVKVFEERASHTEEMNKGGLSLHKEAQNIDHKTLDIEREIAQANSSRSLLGLWGGFVLLLFALGLGGYSIHKDQQKVAITIFGGTIATLALNYAGNILNAKNKWQENNTKNEDKQIEASSEN